MLQGAFEKRTGMGAGAPGARQPYGICVLTVTGGSIRRISSFGDPSLVTVFGF